jgi:hypothetical protein
MVRGTDQPIDRRIRRMWVCNGVMLAVCILITFVSSFNLFAQIILVVCGAIGFWDILHVLLHLARNPTSHQPDQENYDACREPDQPADNQARG